MTAHRARPLGMRSISTAIHQPTFGSVDIRLINKKAYTLVTQPAQGKASR